MRETVLIASSACRWPRQVVTQEQRRAAFERGRERWPSLGLNYEHFAAHLDRLGWSHALPSQVEALYLCAGCSLGLERACRELDDAYFPRLEQALSRRYKSTDFVAEVLQVTRERLLVKPSARIASYRGVGCLEAWLRVIAQRVAVDLRRSEAVRRRHVFEEWQRCYALDVPTDGLIGSSRDGVLDGGWLDQLKRAILEATANLDPADRRLLHLYYARGEPVDEIGARLGVDRSTVYRQLDRVRRRLSSSVRKAVYDPADQLANEDLDGLLRASWGLIDLDVKLWAAVGDWDRVGPGGAVSTHAIQP